MSNEYTATLIETFLEILFQTLSPAVSGIYDIHLDQCITVEYA